ncbi:MAG TPA: hydroxymethylbilane synthase [Methanocorpusculum sp.]|nr:hydroxymethylbilane synthase [Candidatus Methanocorpusculum equi]MCQ2357987.1 hydroxymethylbilane synthase [Methanocorpusculum sp.]HJJ44829.1 hydroxymethylbilane synthase [Methanocorpusculum sp.]HJJ59533.1 hydroxymethylbilane synthase [Methanocorpusculum sp.]
MSVIRLGTRGSKLALAQTKRVADLLLKQGVASETVVITTKGDALRDRTLQEAGGFGLFVRELDSAILEGRIDAAVHSMKDIPLERPVGLVTAAVLRRDSPFDYFVAEKPMDEVYRIGTSSLRRRAQLLRYYHKYPEMHVAPLRGNIDTRLAKLSSGEYDAIVIAEAGLSRLGLRVNGVRLPADVFVPSPNQGTIAVVSRDTDELRSVFAPINDAESAFSTAVERAVMEELGVGCFTPFGAYCQGGRLLAEVLSLDGKRAERVESDVPSLEAAHAIGRAFYERAKYLIDEARDKIEGGV